MLWEILLFREIHAEAANNVDVRKSASTCKVMKGIITSAIILQLLTKGVSAAYMNATILHLALSTLYARVGPNQDIF